MHSTNSIAGQTRDFKPSVKLYKIFELEYEV